MKRENDKTLPLVCLSSHWNRDPATCCCGHGPTCSVPSWWWWIGTLQTVSPANLSSLKQLPVGCLVTVMRKITNVHPYNSSSAHVEKPWTSGPVWLFPYLEIQVFKFVLLEIYLKSSAFLFLNHAFLLWEKKETKHCNPEDSFGFKRLKPVINRGELKINVMILNPR